jgi:hypothetical protein
MTFTYDTTRDSEQLRLLTTVVDAFIAKYGTPSTSTCARQTVFFFPGGMASQLKRADQPFIDGVATPQTFNYDPVWIAFDTFVGGARDLKMHRDGAGVFRDKDDRIIVADGAINLLGCTPHDGFINWCANNNVDLFVFDWDWRRRLEETVRFFVGQFLPFFKARVIAAGLPDPLAKFSLVGHSFGGMIVNLILRGNDPMVANVARAITVGTPFYGYAGQAHRWFEGDRLLNGPFNVFRTDIVKAISSLPALYTLLFLDEVTYNDSTNQLGLTNDPAFPLADYPSLDATTPGLRADAYNPQTVGTQVRYPANTGFDRNELDYARLQFQQMAAPMAANLLLKFYNIRGVRTANDTVGSVTCDVIAPIFNPATKASPIADGPSVPGDHTQPAWTTRLVINDPSRCIAVTASDIEHMFLMSHAQIVTAIAAILCAPGAAMNPPDTTQPEPASVEEVLEFLRWLYSQRATKRSWPHLDDPALLEFLPPRFRSRFGAISRRIMMDIMKRPGPQGEPGPQARGRKPPAKKSATRKPAARGGQRRSTKKKR